MNTYRLGSRNFENPGYIAAGLLKTIDHVKQVVGLPMNVIVIGSTTVKQRPGNIGDTEYSSGLLSGYSNFKGLPSASVEEYTSRIWPEAAKIAADAGKLLCASLAGFSPDEYAHLAGAAVSAGVTAVELNYGCPNVVDGNTQHPVNGFDRDFVAAATHKVIMETGGSIEIFPKFPPFSNPAELAAMARLIVGFAEDLSGVIIANTWPNGLALNENGKPHITLEDDPNYIGYAGYSGHGMHVGYVGNAKQWIRALEGSDLDVIGVGGVIGGEDGLHFLDAGCTAFQYASAVAEQGYSCVGRINEELGKLLVAREQRLAKV